MATNLEMGRGFNFVCKNRDRCMVMTGYFNWAVKGSMIAAVLSLCEGLLKLQAFKLWDFYPLVFLEVMSSHKLYYTKKNSCHVQIGIFFFKKKIKVVWRELVPCIS